MYVIKRDGTEEPIDIRKIQSKVDYFNSYPTILKNTDTKIVVDEVVKGLSNRIHTSQIDEFTAKSAVIYSAKHPEYAILGARIILNNHHKNTQTSLKDKMTQLYYRTDDKGNVCSLLDRTFYKFIAANQNELEEIIDYKRDYLLDYFGFKTLEKTYLIRINEKVIERPQDLFMREAIDLCMNDDNFKDDKALTRIRETYNLLSLKKYTHATPTLFNAGSKYPQYSSCFLLGTKDSRQGINKTFDDCSVISKHGGGIGFHLNWRSRGTLIRGTNGMSNGIANFLRIFDVGSRAYNQGGKRQGNFAVYLDTYHPDVEEFLDLKKQDGDYNIRARDLFYALCYSDLFLNAVENDTDWYLIDPDEVPEIATTVCEEYEKVYKEAVAKKKYRRSVRAKELWGQVVLRLKETGGPFSFFIDSANRKSNLKHYPKPIKSSNLCTEIVLPSDAYEYAVCNLSSIVLASFVIEKDDLTKKLDERVFSVSYEQKLKYKNPVFDFQAFTHVVRIATRNTDRVIDLNFYPTKETCISNLLHRPIGMGVSGLAEVFYKMRIPYDSPQAEKLNKMIFETFAYAAISESTLIAKENWKALEKSSGQKLTLQEFKKKVDAIFALFAKHCKLVDLESNIEQEIVNGSANLEAIEALRKECYPFVPKLREMVKEIPFYPSMLYGEGAPILKGEFQWKLWGLKKEDLSQELNLDWDTLADHIARWGIHNSLLTAPMPTASTSQIMGVTESFEPCTSNLYKRKTLAGEFIVINPYLVYDLIELGIWNEDLENYLKKYDGSIQNISGIPENLKQIYKTVWEISQRTLINHAAARGPFIDHSQSLNLFLANPTSEQISAMLRYAWKKGMKSTYYLRTQPAITPQKFTLKQSIKNEIEETKEVVIETQPLECLMCSS